MDQPVVTMELTPAGMEVLAGVAQKQMMEGQLAQSLITLRPMWERQPDHPLVLTAFALAAYNLHDCGTETYAGEAMERALRLIEAAAARTDTAFVHYNLGIMYRLAGRHAAAAEAHRRALAQSPNLLPALSEYGACLAALGHHENAAIPLRRVLSMQTDSPYEHMAQANAAGLLGRPERMWKLLEARLHIPTMRIMGPLPTGVVMWKGEPDVPVIVFAEQGYGDMIMMARYLPDLLARQAKVACVVRDPLIRLLQRQWPALEVVTSGAILSGYTHAVACMSLPHLMPWPPSRVPYFSREAT